MNKWLERIDEVYLINLAKRTDRLLQAAEELEKFNIPYKRISAIEKENGAEGLRDTMLMIFNEALEQGYERILIFEDDAMAMPNEDVNFVMDKAMEQLPDSFNILYLGGQATRGFTHFHSPHLLPITGCFATHAAIYSRQCMRYCIDLQIGFPVDNWITKNIQDEFGNCYITYPMLMEQRPGISDIGGGQWVDWRPFISTRYLQKMHELRSRM